MMLEEVVHGTTIFAFAFVKAYWVKLKVRIAIMNVMIINIVERSEFGIAVILLETVCKAMKVPAINPSMYPIAFNL